MASTDPGPSDHLVTRALERELSGLAAEVSTSTPLDAAEAPDRLARHAMAELRVELLDEEEPADAQARTGQRRSCARFAGSDGRRRGRAPGSRASGHQGPVAAWRRRAAAAGAGDAVQPERPARQRRGPAEHRLRAAAELATADSVDLICAFVIWSGVRHLRDALAGVMARGGRVRVITTTYMGATQKRAVDELVRARRGGPGRVRRAHDQAAREGVAARARVRPDAPRSSARRTSRTRRSSTGSSGTCGCRRWTRRTSSTASG